MEFDSLIVKNMVRPAMLAAVAVGVCFGAMARDTATDLKNSDYVFTRNHRPIAVRGYNTTAFSHSRGEVNTMRGDALRAGKDSIMDMRVSPAGVNFGLVSKGKKSNQATFWSTLDKERRVGRFDEKRYGIPTAICYMPDARSVLVATDKGIYILDSRKFQLVGKIDLVPIVPSAMAVSPNGYYLAISEGSKVVVYNLENKTIRKRWDEGEAVSDFSFSPDSDDLAVATADGLVNIYSTRTFDIRKTIDDLGEARSISFNFDGKYLAVAESADRLVIVNLLRDSDRDTIDLEGGGGSLEFLKDSNGNTLLVYTDNYCIKANRLPGLKPYYNRLINDEVDQRMADWLKMMPGESMEDYRQRVNEENRVRQRRLFEDEISTNLAGDLLADATMSLGSYDRSNGVLALNFSTMPTIFLPVPESDVVNFKDVSGLTMSDVKYGITPDDTFEVIYAVVTNSADGKQYVYDNLQRRQIDFMAADDAISIELLQQQQMEELRLQELREKIIAEARQDNIISDHTSITVDSRMVPEYDADGNRILNYVVNITYQVDPEFSAVEDFGPGKYHVGESGAASSMLKIVKEAFEGDFAQYLGQGKKLRVTLKGTADATPILRGIPYDGSYGEYEDEPIWKDGALTTVNITRKDGIRTNEQLAFLRALGVSDHLEKNVKGFAETAKEYKYEVNVSQDRGSEHRRITAEFIFVNAF